jgi:hypothetical protein
MLGASVVATATYQTHAVSGVDGPTFTFSSQAIGTAASDRRVIVGVVGGVSTTTVSSLTIGGNSATLVTRRQDGGCTAELWIALVTSGTTADVVVTWGTLQGRCAIAVWSTAGLTSNTPSDTDGATIAAGSSSVSITTQANGFVVGVGYEFDNDTASPAAIDWNNVTERVTATIETHPGSNTHQITAADLSTSGGALSVGITTTGGTPTFQSPCIVAAFP